MKHNVSKDSGKRTGWGRGRIVGLLLLGLLGSIGWGDYIMAQQDVLEPGRIPALLPVLRIDYPLEFCGEPVPMDNQDVRERLEKALVVSLWERAQIILWIKRAGRYFPVIERMLAQRKMPDDLKYIAVVESALRPHVGSHKRAIGFWQFIASTGKKYGLTINDNIDERRNIFKSTQAALDYLKDLHDEFGSWTIAAAAYNMGEKWMASEIAYQKTRDFYKLYLPLETQHHIMKIIAAKMIFSNPQKFGFDIQASDLWPPLEFDEIQVQCKENTPLQLIAEAAGTYYKVIKDMNPEVRGRYLKPGSYTLLVPEGSGIHFYKKYNRLMENRKVLTKKRGKSKKQRARVVYTVQHGDSLSIISNKFNVPLRKLLRWNKLSLNKPIYPGDKIVIFKE